MQVQQVMTPAPSACGPDANLCQAIQMMWDGDFGVIPVIDERGVVQGVVTDRDISIAVGTRNRKPAELTVADAMSGPVLTCRGRDDLRAALETMATNRVRRLPVVDDENRLCGILSINDAVLAADGAIEAEEILHALQAICTHQLPQKAEVVAA